MNSEAPIVFGRVPAAEFLPYRYGRMDDWSMLDTAAAPASRTGEEELRWTSAPRV